MRELPPSSVVNVQEDSAIIAFINDDSIRIHPQHWTASASLQNQVKYLGVCINDADCFILTLPGICIC